MELTNQCNLRCRHCYASAREKLENELSLDEVKQLLRELSQVGTVEVEFSGGEPLLRPDLFEIIEYAKGLDFSVVLITNGTLVDRETAKRLGSLGLKHVQVSLDGLKENHLSEALQNYLLSQYQVISTLIILDKSMISKKPYCVLFT